jgi:hypothetical protein
MKWHKTKCGQGASFIEDFYLGKSKLLRRQR